MSRGGNICEVNQKIRLQGYFLNVFSDDIQLFPIIILPCSSFHSLIFRDLQSRNRNRISIREYSRIEFRFPTGRNLLVWHCRNEFLDLISWENEVVATRGFSGRTESKSWPPLKRGKIWTGMASIPFGAVVQRPFVSVDLHLLQQQSRTESVERLQLRAKSCAKLIPFSTVANLQVSRVQMCVQIIWPSV